jgi:endonuclease/exonuclease/phosphatase family metal-dependent hydrolase
MKRAILNTLILLAMVDPGLCQKREPLRVMTFNIRYNTPADGEDAWPFRKEMAASMIRFHRADLVGLQEALKNQIDDLETLLPEYGWFGLGRDDGKEAGEFSAILYLESRFEILESQTFWLSETPEKPGPGWDARLNRVVTWGKLKDLENNEVFFFFNTHFDHQAETARRESARLVKRKIEELTEELPVILCGDFNATPDSEPYRIILDATQNVLLKDTKGMSTGLHHGPNTTFNGFKADYFENDERVIDHIFVTSQFKVASHGTLSESMEGHFPSDHFPVLAELYFPR